MGAAEDQASPVPGHCMAGEGSQVTRLIADIATTLKALESLSLDALVFDLRLMCLPFASCALACVVLSAPGM